MQRLPILSRMFLIVTFLFGTNPTGMYVWLIIAPARAYNGVLARKLGCILYGSAIPLIAAFEEEAVHDTSGNDLYGISIVT